MTTLEPVLAGAPRTPGIFSSSALSLAFSALILVRSASAACSLFISCSTTTFAALSWVAKVEVSDSVSSMSTMDLSRICTMSSVESLRPKAAGTDSLRDLGRLGDEGVS